MHDAESKDLPTVLQGDLDADQRAAYFDDLSALASVDAVFVRFRDPVTPDRMVPIDAAAQASERGDLSMVRAEYRHDGAHWRDTVLIRSDGARLVRMQLTDGGSE